MHTEPDPNHPPVEGSHIAQVDWHGNVTMDLELLEKVGVYGAKWAGDGKSPLGSWVPEYEDDEDDDLEAQTVVAALRAGFLLLHTPQIPEMWIVAHPWPNAIDRHDGPWRFANITRPGSTGPAPAGIVRTREGTSAGSGSIENLRVTEAVRAGGLPT